LPSRTASRAILGLAILIAQKQNRGLAGESGGASRWLFVLKIVVTTSDTGMYYQT
jgi:hypothetical protein